MLPSLADDLPQNSTLLKQTLETLIDHKIGEFSTHVNLGYTRKTWAPILTIHLDRLRGTDGSAIGRLVQKNHGEYIAVMLGQTFKVEWNSTSWAYRNTPIKVAELKNHISREEDE